MSALHMVQLVLDARQLYRDHGHRREDMDEGYAIHSAFASLFDPGKSPDERVAPKPFAIMKSEGATIQVLAYSRIDARELEVRARELASVTLRAALARGIESKEVPLFQSGQELSFEVRACPTRRLGRGHGESAGREVDAFIARVLQVVEGTPLDREQIYIEWLTDQFSKTSGASLLGVAVERMSLDRVLRRTQGNERTSKKPRLPDVTYKGRLRIDDPDVFLAFLSRGVGRHRSFGFGMLLLKP